jgi:hypothetical protein
MCVRAPPKNRGGERIVLVMNTLGSALAARCRAEWLSVITAIHYAIPLSSYHCFLYTSVPSVALHLAEFTFLGGFESLPLRHTVWRAQKFPRAFPKIGKRRQFFAIFAQQNGLQRTHCLRRKGSLSRLFSGRSPAVAHPHTDGENLLFPS